MNERTLPPWHDAMSDGCSIPTALKQFFPDSPQIRNACVLHDELYYYGGSREDRLRADLEWAMLLLDSGEVSAESAEKMFHFVRVLGGPSGRQSYSWAFGGKRYQYDEFPAKPKGA